MEEQNQWKLNQKKAKKTDWKSIKTAESRFGVITQMSSEDSYDPPIDGNAEYHGLQASGENGDFDNHYQSMLRSVPNTKSLLLGSRESIAPVGPMTMDGQTRGSEIYKNVDTFGADPSEQYYNITNKSDPYYNVNSFVKNKHQQPNPGQSPNENAGEYTSIKDSDKSTEQSTGAYANYAYEDRM